MVNFNELIRHLGEKGEPFGLLSMQAVSTRERLMAAFPDRMKCLFSAEHGYYGSAAPGEKTASTWHPYWNMPIHSLYGTTRKPTDEMLEGLGRVVIDLQDIGVRCYTYMATVKNMLEACAERHLPVTVVDRAVPLGGIVDGPMRQPSYSSFVAPVNVPLCHGMTVGEYSTWIVQKEKLDLDLYVVKQYDWDHKSRMPWMNFVPPSPAIKSWDSAVMYPMTVFTEAFPAIDCDRQGSLAFRVIGAPWLDQKWLVAELQPGLATCGVDIRPYRYQYSDGLLKGSNCNGLLFSVARPEAFYPVTAGVLVLAALFNRHAKQILVGAKTDWYDKLMGTGEVLNAIRADRLSELFQSWLEGRDEYLASRVNFYPGE